MCTSSPSPPPLPAPPAPAPEAPKKSDDAVKKARREAELKRRNMQGDKSTKLTGARGLMAPVNKGKATALGGN